MTLTSILISVLGFILALGVKELMSIAKTVNEIKTSFSVLENKHNNLETRVQDLEDD